MTINEIQDEIIEEFADFDDWMDRYQLVTHTQQRIAGHAQADETLCLGFPG